MQPSGKVIGVLYKGKRMGLWCRRVCTYIKVRTTSHLHIVIPCTTAAELRTAWQRLMPVRDWPIAGKGAYVFDILIILEYFICMLFMAAVFNALMQVRRVQGMCGA